MATLVMIAAVLVGVISLAAVLPIVLKVRDDPPPLPISIFAALIGLAPWRSVRAFLGCHCWLVQQWSPRVRRPLLDKPAVAPCQYRPAAPLVEDVAFAQRLLQTGNAGVGDVRSFQIQVRKVLQARQFLNSGIRQRFVGQR